ncbi:GntR family transcriptional regulator [Micromonospora chalcea]|uniref:GntR family transcriptional regulator n=1 Tax=Micromonospora chalcea TaxID=1874 RepID=UPI0033C256AE
MSLTSERLDRTPLGQRIADALRHDILFGRLAPGTKLAQTQVCERFGTSRMPVRDALRQLTYEGFLTGDGGGHSVVAPLRRHDIEDSFLIEGQLHGIATRRVAERADPAHLAELAERHAQMCGAAEDAQLAADLNWHLHRRINQMAQSRRLIVALRALAVTIPRDLLLEFPQWIDRANDEHAQIIAAVAAGRGEQAADLMRDHVAEAGRDLVRYLEKKGVDLT